MKARFEVVEVKVDKYTSEQTYFFSSSHDTYEEALAHVADYYENGPGYHEPRLFNIEKCYGPSRTTEEVKKRELDSILR